MNPARRPTAFLQAVIVLIGLVALVLMLWEPHLEGRNAHATTFEIYFKDPFLAYAYTSSIAFFAALFQAFKLLGFIGRNQLFSPESVRALRIIKYCASLLVVLVGAAVAYLFIFMRDKDDIAGGVAIGLAMILVFAIIATAAAVYEKRVQNGMNMGSRDNVTV